MIRRLAGKRGPITGVDLLHLAAHDDTLSDNALGALADALGPGIEDRN